MMLFRNQRNFGIISDLFLMSKSGVSHRARQPQNARILRKRKVHFGELFYILIYRPIDRAPVMTSRVIGSKLLPPAVTWHNLDTKTLFLLILSVVSWISFY